MNRNNLPKPPKLIKMLGPSFILLGLGLGSGEIILWPYLTSKYGMGIIWGALLGITFQFFINMEIERYTLITGESVFVGLEKYLKKFSPIWFIFSTLLPWIWPGIIASSAILFASILHINYSPIIPIILLLIIGIFLTLGPVIYKTQETFQKTLIIIGVPFILLLTFFLAKSNDWQALFNGLIAKGDGYFFLPTAIPLVTLLSAFVYSGAGGNLNLAQSFYIKEKGYGMGKYSGRITSILTGKKEKIELKGKPFEKNTKNLKLFKLWWKRMNLEHFFVFWLTGLLTMLFLSLLAFITTYGKDAGEGINFILMESSTISSRTLPLVGASFLIVSALMLFSTQFSILDATSRIMSENLVILSPKKFKISNLRSYYYLFLWFQIFAGILIFSLGITEPLKLITIGAVLNAVAMFFYTGLILLLNNLSFKKPIKPLFFRNLILIIVFFFYGLFVTITLVNIF
ncbi:Nramp family divalent metal transporter [Patescibacteria group bacterium]|nr:Nramp family divalent metal transporter [Patescibacteria group bacterium]